MPLAIQLFNSKPREENPIWTPNDKPEEWLLAKMFFNNSNGQVMYIIHQAVLLILYC